MSVYRVGGNKSSQNVFPSVRPTLDLDFANSKTLDPRITFTRASGGSYVGADGLIKYAGVNEARFDHDPETGESLGLLIEEARTNISAQSEDLSQSVWNKNGECTVTGGQLSPRGDFSAFLVQNAVDSTDVIGRNNLRKNDASIQGLAADRYIMTFYAKANGSTTRMNVRTRFPAGITDSNTGFFLTNEWTRIVVPAIESDISTSLRLIIYANSSDGFYLWGAQLEQGSFPTSYIPTQASTRTRAADNASITGKNFSEWYRQDEGSIRLSYSFIGSNVDNTIFAINNTTQNEQIDSRWFATGTGYRVRVGGVNQASYASEGDVPPIPFKKYQSSFGYQKNNFVMSLNGKKSIDDTSGDLPGSGAASGPIQMELGKRTNTHRGNLTLSRFTYFPKRLPNEQLIALTR
jgi:hypothetical protein